MVTKDPHDQEPVSKPYIPIDSDEELPPGSRLLLSDYRETDDDAWPPSPRLERFLWPHVRPCVERVILHGCYVDGLNPFTDYGNGNPGKTRWLWSIARELVNAGLSDDQVASAFRKTEFSSTHKTMIESWIHKAHTTFEKPLACWGIPKEAHNELCCKNCPDFQPAPQYNDTGNARRTSWLHSHELRHLASAEQWYRWQDTHWAPVLDIQVRAYAVTHMVRDHQKECAALHYWLQKESKAQNFATEEAEKSAWKLHSKKFNWVESSGNVRNQNSCIDKLRDSLKIAVGDDYFDQNPFLFNCLNRTINLRAKHHKHFRPHSYTQEKSDHITKLCPTEYDLSAICPNWIRFLNQMLPDPKVRRFLQKSIGYTLSGLISERLMFICWGHGANGKSAFLDTITHVLGSDYCKRLKTETLMDSHVEQHPTDLKQIAGRRMVILSEAKKKHRWNVSLFKRLTSNRTFSARGMREDAQLLENDMKLWLDTNYLPFVPADDEGFWDRVVVIYWPIRIKVEDRIPEFAEEYLFPEATGILQWMLQGFLMYLREGFKNRPKEVSAAVTLYRDDADKVKAFVEEVCVVDTTVAVSGMDLNEAWKEWHTKIFSGKPPGRKYLTSNLERLGFRADFPKGKRTKWYWGLRLMTSVEQKEEEEKDIETPLADLDRIKLEEEELLREIRKLKKKYDYNQGKQTIIKLFESLDVRELDITILEESCQVKDLGGVLDKMCRECIIAKLVNGAIRYLKA